MTHYLTFTPDPDAEEPYAWWDDLPPGSIVEVNRQVLHRDIDGTWWYGLLQIWPDQDIAPEIREKVRVIEVPVTDQEPPVGSIVVCDDDSIYRRTALDDDPFSWVSDDPGVWSAWESVRPNVTRILRWGE